MLQLFANMGDYQLELLNLQQKRKLNWFFLINSCK